MNSINFTEEEMVHFYAQYLMEYYNTYMRKGYLGKLPHFSVNVKQYAKKEEMVPVGLRHQINVEELVTLSRQNTLFRIGKYAFACILWVLIVGNKEVFKYHAVYHLNKVFSKTSSSVNRARGYVFKILFWAKYYDVFCLLMANGIIQYNSHWYDGVLSKQSNWVNWISENCAPNEDQDRWLCDLYYAATVMNDAKAQFQLGKCYAEGIGVNIDFNEAVKWFKKCADHDKLEEEIIAKREAKEKQTGRLLTKTFYFILFIPFEIFLVVTGVICLCAGQLWGALLFVFAILIGKALHVNYKNQFPR